MRLSYNEFCQWLRYRNKRGSLNGGMRSERAAAEICKLYANANSKTPKFRIHDFAPYHDEPPISLEDAMNSW